MFLAESMKGHKRVRSGDLVINTMWAWITALKTRPLGSHWSGLWIVDHDPTTIRSTRLTRS